MSEASSPVDVQAFLNSHPQTRISPDEIARRAEAIYADLRDRIDTPENLGRFFSIDIESGDIELGERHETARLLRARRPDAVIFTIKVGYSAAVSMAGSIRPCRDERGCLVQAGCRTSYCYQTDYGH